MTIHCTVHPDGGCGCVQSPCETVVYYSVAEIKGYFTDSLARGVPENGQIIEYFWDEPTSKTHAIITNKLTGVSEYAMNVVTRKPYRIRTIRVDPPKSTRSRPRKPGTAISRATIAWQER